MATNDLPESTFSVGMLVYPNCTQLDLTGPHEVFARLPGASVHLIAAAVAPVRCQYGLTLVPDVSFDQAPALDLLFVPGGPGQVAMMENEAFIGFLRARADQVRYLTAVCTGSLLLGAAGLLRGYRATTHWLSLDLLPLLGARAVADRVVVDRNRITGAGVTAGIDFGLVVAAAVCGEETARAIQLGIEYDPAPPFASGSPRSATPALVEQLTAAQADFQARRRAQAQRIGARLGIAQQSVDG